MIELEVQALSATRDGLLIDVGKAVVASGFTLQRQRLVQDPHGVLMTLVVRGPARKQRALEVALEANERIISFEVTPFEDGPPKPHFAASRTFAREPAPLIKPAAEPVAAPTVVEPPKAVEPSVIPAVPAQPERQAPTPPPPLQQVPEPEPDPDFMFLLEPKSSPAPAPASVPVEPFVEMMPLEPDVEAVDKALPRLQFDYPRVFPALQKLEESVVAAAREPSLLLAGQRTGSWVFARDHGAATKLDLEEAIKRIGVPALSAVVEVEYKGEGLHIRNSPLCAPNGHSGCKFFSGYLEGLLGPALASGSLSIFEVCCRSYGADTCILAISE
ncbi:hypothetical protein [Dyella caseinilytica]|uniref:4-vinyl reductase 4VR domain-containing protein n=1 Tax=Dyella caseinilytica TaxID=1849581 RepID=A0ABX7GWG4_9GAMM|nr:hypothetical protein [Dyella caseinilytica]QRN54835.1 hypothetical protein ISN74_05630 [Dyella caseinilytica]GFZ97246.1 hypothetical protein GCM10011408_17140 [Dyella caseinilytica]